MGGVFRDLLPIGLVEMSILGVAPNPELESIASRVQVSLAENPEWASEYLAEIASLRPGETAPYHENLGISEEEYARLLSSADDAQLTSVGILQLAIAQVDGGLRIVAPQLPELGEILIDLQAIAIQTDDGYIEDCHQVLANQESAAIGQWEGVSCTLEQGNPLFGSARRVSFSVGRIQESSELYIGFRSQVIEGGEMTRNFQLNLSTDDSP